MSEKCVSLRDIFAAYRRYLGVNERSGFREKAERRNGARQKHMQNWWGGAKDEEPKRSRRETIARSCVKNEDIQMEIWFYINHQPESSPRRSVWLLFCLLSLPLFLFHTLPSVSFFLSSPPFIGSRAHISLRRLPSPVSSSRFDPRFSARSRSSCSPSLFRDAWPCSYRWQRDSFVLSRRFQLIFIVYLSDQRYLEDNGPPRYIRNEPYHANTEVYLLSSLASGRCGSLLSPHPFDLSETDCVNRHRWVLLISIS